MRRTPVSGYAPWGVLVKCEFYTSRCTITKSFGEHQANGMVGCKFKLPVIHLGANTNTENSNMGDQKNGTKINNVLIQLHATNARIVHEAPI